jgi:hypothetical protein
MHTTLWLKTLKGKVTLETQSIGLTVKWKLILVWSWQLELARCLVSQKLLWTFMVHKSKKKLVDQLSIIVQESNCMSPSNPFCVRAQHYNFIDIHLLIYWYTVSFNVCMQENYINEYLLSLSLRSLSLVSKSVRKGFVYSFAHHLRTCHGELEADKNFKRCPHFMEIIIPYLIP